MSERFNPDQFAVDTDRDFPGYLSAWRFAVANVGNLESELERAFLAHWTFATYRGGWSSYGGVHPGGEIAKYDLTAQRWIDEYRVDFALDVLSSRGVVATTAVIEVDGFSYHGDRDSFELDRARDQFFHAAGLTVFRFTPGSTTNPRSKPL